MVLTILAPEIAARTGDGEAFGARMKMVQRLLFDRVDGQRTGLAVTLAHEHAVHIASASADACLPVRNLAVVRAELTGK